MHTRTLVFVGLCTLVSLIGCKKASDTRQSGDAPPSSSAASENLERFGDPISEGPTVSLSEVLKSPDEFRDKPVTVEGNVRKVCSRKGCWMELSEDAAGEGQGCRVTFKDYGFFVPKDSGGATARAQGIVKINEVSADDVEHYESEGATFKSKREDGTAQEVRFIASGVELTRR
jgi:hypothetical protein